LRSWELSWSGNLAHPWFWSAWKTVGGCFGIHNFLQVFCFRKTPNPLLKAFENHQLVDAFIVTKYFREKHVNNCIKHTIIIIRAKYFETSLHAKERDQNWWWHIHRHGFKRLYMNIYSQFQVYHHEFSVLLLLPSWVFVSKLSINNNNNNNNNCMNKDIK